MKVLVCGGRDYARFPGHDASPELKAKYEREKRVIYNAIYDVCDEFGLWTDPDDYGNTMPKDITIISGMARGVDTTAVDWAVVNWCPVEEYAADWKQYGNRAGPIRNAQMLREGKPDLVLAGPGGKGTDNMIKQAEKAGVEVIKIDPSKYE